MGPEPQTPSTAPLPDDEPAAIGSIAARWADAWNTHDADAMADLVATDVDFVSVSGQGLRGADEFRQMHRELHRMQMRDSRWTNVGHRIRTLQDDLALVHLEWTIVGDREPDGTLRSPRRGIFTWLIARCGRYWQIIAAQNTNLRVDVNHRLANPRSEVPCEIGGRP
jgi:uncharacterized protein (TIGR02246 family)